MADTEAKLHGAVVRAVVVLLLQVGEARDRFNIGAKAPAPAAPAVAACCAYTGSHMPLQLSVSTQPSLDRARLLLLRRVMVNRLVRCCDHRKT